MQLSDLVEWELDLYRLQCNFTEEELSFFNYRAKNVTIEEIAERMNISVGKANKLSSKIKEKMSKVL